MTPRKEVQKFAERMEETLRENDDKGGWERCSFQYLIQRLREETNELEQEFNSYMISLAMPRDLSGARSRGQYGEVEKEARDISNFAMMISDNLIHQRFVDNEEDESAVARKALERARGLGQSRP